MQKKTQERSILENSLRIIPVTVEVLPDGRLNVKNAAKYIGCGVKSLYNHGKERGWPPYVKINTHTYYYLEDLNEWLHTREKIYPSKKRTT